MKTSEIKLDGVLEELERRLNSLHSSLDSFSSIEEALDFIEMFHYDFGFHNGKASCGMKGGWISVEDRLPDECDEVLCSDGFSYAVVYMVNGHWRPASGVVAQYELVNTVIDFEPTHWIPLPELEGAVVETELERLLQEFKGEIEYTPRWGC